MQKKLDHYRFLGLSREASSAEVEERCQALLRWLRSDAVPQDLRPWAKEQAAVVDDFYRSLSEGEEIEEGEVSLTIEEALPSPKSWRRLAGPVGFALLGILVGVAVIAGVVWGRRGQESPTPTPSAQINPQEFLAAHGPRIAELQALVAQDPSNTEALFELGETYILGEQWEQAIAWFNKLLAVKPDVHAQTDVAIAHMNLGRLAEAEAAFLKAVEIDPTYLPLHYSMGYFYAFKSDPDLAQAERHWREVIRLAPDSDMAATARIHLEQLGLSTPPP